MVKPLTNSWSMTLNQVWSQRSLPKNEGRLIIIYQNQYFTNKNLFFPNIIEDWGNVDTKRHLKAYLDSKTKEARLKGFKPWRIDCQLTPDFSDIVFKRKSLRLYADLVNRYVTSWWKRDYEDLQGVYTLHDFFLGTDMIQVAIARNMKTAKRAFMEEENVEMKPISTEEEQAWDSVLINIL